MEKPQDRQDGVQSNATTDPQRGSPATWLANLLCRVCVRGRSDPWVRSLHVTCFPEAASVPGYLAVLQSHPFIPQIIQVRARAQCHHGKGQCRSLRGALHVGEQGSTVHAKRPGMESSLGVAEACQAILDRSRGSDGDSKWRSHIQASSSEASSVCSFQSF